MLLLGLPGFCTSEHMALVHAQHLIERFFSKIVLWIYHLFWGQAAAVH